MAPEGRRATHGRDVLVLNGIQGAQLGCGDNRSNLYTKLGQEVHGTGVQGPDMRGL